MCQPSAFNVQYEINPWMQGNINHVDILLAWNQWESLKNTIEFCGAQVLLTADPPQNCPDAVFTANAGIALNELFLPSRFTHAERQVEEPFFEHALAAHGMQIVSPPKTFTCEGAGDALFIASHDFLWLGTGFRTTPPAAGIIEHLLNVHVQALELVDPRFYHLDTCFCPLDVGGLLWYPGAFSAASQNFIRAFYADRAIEVLESDALNFACNAISIGEDIILSNISDGLVKELLQKGLRVHQKDMSQFMLAGGACKCLTLELVH